MISPAPASPPTLQPSAPMNLHRSSTPQSIDGSGVRIVFGPGALNHLGAMAAAEHAHRVLIVTDRGIAAAGHVEHAVRSLYKAGLAVRVFDSVEENPTTHHVAHGLRVAKDFKPDLIAGLGGGSSMDCAKGINFLLTNGGEMKDYWGVGKATQPMLPIIAIPTTAGTGSDAQSFALITDPETHQKMACGDPKALPRIAILDPNLTATQPPKVAAATGIDAVAHAIETAGCNKRNPTSLRFSRAAWDLLNGSFDRSMKNPGDAEAREQMLLGAHLAGVAIENSMLGAAHSLANALTAQLGIVHGVAVGLMLPYVIRFNAQHTNSYADLGLSPAELSARIFEMLEAGALPTRLSQLDASVEAIDQMSVIAARQWTATFNPRPVTEADFREILHSAQ